MASDDGIYHGQGGDWSPRDEPQQYKVEGHFGQTNLHGCPTHIWVVIIVVVVGGHSGRAIDRSYGLKVAPQMSYEWQIIQIESRTRLVGLLRVVLVGV